MQLWYFRRQVASHLIIWKSVSKCPIVHKYAGLVEWCQTGNNQIAQRRPVQMPLCPPQTPHEMPKERVVSCLVRSRLPTAWGCGILIWTCFTHREHDSLQRSVKNENRQNSNRGKACDGRYSRIRRKSDTDRRVALMKGKGFGHNVVETSINRMPWQGKKSKNNKKQMTI
jgi:hypothetical protein